MKRNAGWDLRKEKRDIYFIGGDDYYCSYCKKYIKDGSGHLSIEKHEGKIKHIKNLILDGLK